MMILRRVGAGLTTRCEAKMAYAIGKAEPVALFVEPVRPASPSGRRSRSGHWGLTRRR
ncbi:methionine adenosyltransferase domain-containing protein [Streptomyces sp. cmx-4-9]|uniref:methionine adenosyltransferase domain-containing protein n=1 Tax=Streptomyces sp. cmx-4-9 TaxID=2790941 RepID=UPI00397FEDC5